MSQRFDAAIIGGGIVGLATALAMSQRGLSLALIDAGSLDVNPTQSEARVYAINQASQNLLKQLGVWQYLDCKRLAPYRQIYVWDAKTQAHLDFDARLVAAERLGTIIEESLLKQALLQALSTQKNLQCFANHKIKQVEPREDCIRFASETHSWEAELLMIADGGNSPCRQLLNVGLTSWSYHQEALVALVNTEKPHGQTAYQVFNNDGPLAFLPLAKEKQCSIVWSTTPTRAKELMALSDQDFNQALTTAFASKLGQVKVEGKRLQFPLTMRQAQQYSGSRWLLLGDAAHTIHPMAGLGLNVGLADLTSWLACFDKTQDLCAKKGLSAYQRQRKHAVWQIIALLEGLKTLFANPLPPIISLRGLGLRLCNQFSPIKRLLIEQAMGTKD